MKILIAVPKLEQYKEWFEEAAQSRAELLFETPKSLQDPVYMKDKIADVDAIIGNLPPVLWKDATSLKWLQTTNAGVEGYISDAFPSQCILTNMTGAFGCIIAEYIMAGILAQYRRVWAYKDQQRAHIWQDAGAELQLMGKRALILGAGDIGTQTAKRLQAFDVSIIGVRKNVREVPAYFEKMITLEEIDQYLPTVDIVIGCMPHTEQTYHILNETRLRSMKKDALLVNAGRGSLIDTNALVTVLKEGHLLGAVLDVMEQEPLPKDHPLWELDQVFMTPHVSGLSFGHAKQVEEWIIRFCCENLRRYINGDVLKNQVDRKQGYTDYHNSAGFGSDLREDKENG